MLKYLIGLAILVVAVVVTLIQYYSGRLAIGVYDDYERAIVACARNSAEGAKMIELIERRFSERARPKDLRQDILECLASDI